MSNFSLTDERGDLVSRKATSGDHIKINIPAPNTKIGSGYDTIEEIKLEVLDDAELSSMTAWPSTNPLTSSTYTAHFLTNEATSTFQVKHIGRAIYAEEHSRNEVPNSDTENSLYNFEILLLDGLQSLIFPTHSGKLW